MSPARSEMRPGAISASLTKSRAPLSDRNSAQAESATTPPTFPTQRVNGSGAEITLETPLLAQYAVSHYLEQNRVLDADVVE